MFLSCQRINCVEALLKLQYDRFGKMEVYVLGYIVPFKITNMNSGKLTQVFSYRCLR